MISNTQRIIDSMYDPKGSERERKAQRVKKSKEAKQARRRLYLESVL